MNLPKFLGALRDAQVAPNTLRAYEADLRSFAEWYSGTNGEPCTARDITPTDLREYRSFLITRSASPATVNRRLAALRRYLGWAHDVGLTSSVPSVPKALQRPVEAPKSLDKAQEHAFYRAVERSGSLRDLALVTLMFNTGLRVGEVVALRLSDLDVSPKKGEVRVRTAKGNKARAVPLNSEARQALRAYLAVRPPAAHDYVFVGQRGGLGVRGVEALFAKYAYDARLEGVTPHTARHTFLTKLVRGGVDTVLAANLAGHSGLATIALYTQPSARDKERAVESLC